MSERATAGDPRPRRLSDLLAGVTEVVARRVVGPADVDVTDVAHDSREVVPGALFVCVRGATSDGHGFAAAAVRAGAGALVVDHELSGFDVTQIVVDDTRQALGWFAAEFFDRPARQLTMVGVTGTNGKTTTTHLVAAVLQAAGVSTGTIGTLSGLRTTPEAPELQRRLAGFVASGTQAVVMEVSSHALALHRVLGCHFDVSIFTNLGRDHLDLHKTQERYFAAKALLFEPNLTDRAVVNADDLHGRLLIDAATVPTTPFGMADVTDVEADAARHAYTWRGVRIEVALGGRFNVANSLAAATACAELGIAPATIAAGLAGAKPVPGRFEAVAAGQPFGVIVDYAHTPDGLREVLGAARASATGRRVIAVFGCGGERDHDKRAEMGAAAAEMADLVIVTSDNPRSEDPGSIIDAVIAGVPADYRDRAAIEPDRRAAIGAALHAAQPGDVVVIAGKGHEATQTIGDSAFPFDDRVVARELLETMDTTGHNEASHTEAGRTGDAGGRASGQPSDDAAGGPA